MPTRRTSLKISGGGDGWYVLDGTLADVATTMGLDRLRVEIIDLIGSLVDADGDPASFEGGYYRSDDDHVVLLQRTLSPDEAGRTLWHELSHAWQTQHLFAGDSELLAESSEEDDTFELIARAMEHHNETMPLVRQEMENE